LIKFEIFVKPRKAESNVRLLYDLPLGFGVRIPELTIHIKEAKY